MPAGFSTRTCADASSAAAGVLGKMIVRHRDDHDVELACQQLVERRDTPTRRTDAATDPAARASTSKQATSLSGPSAAARL